MKKKKWKTKYLHLKMNVFKNLCYENSKEEVILPVSINLVYYEMFDVSFSKTLITINILSNQV